MPSPKSYKRTGGEKNKKGRLSEKSSSFHEKSGREVAETLPRPRTVPELLVGRRADASFPSVVHGRPKLTKLLLKVTIQRSPGAVQVVMPPESTVADLIKAALQQYAKEGRRPFLAATDPSGFGLHYSQFSLESLDRDEKLVDLGSRNFFMCPMMATATMESSDAAMGMTSSSCANEAEKPTKKGLTWFKFMDLLL